MLTLLSIALAPTVAGLANGIGRLPAMGWNSWNAYDCNISESKFLDAAAQMVSLGLKDAGYEYVNIDDCWSVKTHRDSVTQRLIPDPERFPNNGIRGTADRVHALGLKLGIYSSAGTATCAGYPASLGYEDIDATAWAEWEVDYLKYDNCNIPANWTDVCDACVPDSYWQAPGSLVNGSCTAADHADHDDHAGHWCPDGYDYAQSNTAERFRRMRDALARQDRPILYSLCDWGFGGVQQWGNATGHSWRSTADIKPHWAKIVEIVTENSFYLNHVNFYGHSDPDMLEIGNANLTAAETRSHFALWAAMKSPLLIGTDLARLSGDELAVLTNKHLIAFNQDTVYGAPAAPYKWGTNPDWTFNASYPAEYWSGASQNGTLVLVFNPANTTRHRAIDFVDVPQLQPRPSATYCATDIWTDRQIGCFTDSIPVTVAAHDTVGYLLVERR